MKILSVLNPSLDDYKISGAALLGINLGEYINHNEDNITVDYVASSAIYPFLYSDAKVFTPKLLSKRSVVRDTVEFATNIFYEFGYDIMHIHLHQMSVLESIRNMPKDIPVVYTQHSSTILGRFSLGYRPAAHYLSTTTDRKIKIVCPSITMMQIWYEYNEAHDSDFYNNVCVIKNGINLYSNIYPGDVTLKNRDYYVSCGRIDPNKGMLEVAKFCSEYNHNVILIGSLGMGSMKINDVQKKYYEDFTDLVRKSKNIDWYDYLPNRDIRTIMAEARGYISFSNKESFGLTVAEAMSVGTPILYLEDDAISEITSNSSSERIRRDELYRKKFNSRLSIFEDHYNNLERRINNEEVTVDTVIDNFNNKELSIMDCSKNYIKLYESLM